MDEARKTRQVRDQAFFDTYLNGKVIDIGAGKDLVTETAERFDMEDGDANVITQYRQKQFYDCVHSSHCLEHMIDPVNALSQWWELVKPGGYLVLVVPDEDLYEQGFWPSRFNFDHKSTFGLRNQKSWSPVSFDIEALVLSLPNVKLISIQTQDLNYDYSLQVNQSYRPFNGEPFWFRLLRKMLTQFANRFYEKQLKAKFEKFSNKHYNYPIDQTLYEALAQIQVVAQKMN
jgi:SAM-dependent methyltransferase